MTAIKLLSIFVSFTVGSIALTHYTAVLMRYLRNEVKKSDYHKAYFRWEKN